MRSACVVRTRFILNILVGLHWGGVSGPPGPPLATPVQLVAVGLVTWSYAVRQKKEPLFFYEQMF